MEGKKKGKNKGGQSAKKFIITRLEERLGPTLEKVPETGGRDGGGGGGGGGRITCTQV